jgi:hypothetical protein
MLTFEGEKKKNLAEESQKTRKAREKLKKQLDALEKKITKQGLERKTIEIHRWIARNAPLRIALKTKEISLFDENQNAARLSQTMVKLLDQIRTDMINSSQPARNDFWCKEGHQTRVVYQKKSDGT